MSVLNQNCSQRVHFSFSVYLILLSRAIYTVKKDSVLLLTTLRTSLLCLKWNGVLRCWRNKCFLHACSVLLQLMNSAASERKSNEFWSTCSPSPSYVLIQRCCHKLCKINSVQSVGPGWKHDSIPNTTFLMETKRWERRMSGTGNVWLDLMDFCFWIVFVTSKVSEKGLTSYWHCDPKGWKKWRTIHS